MGFIQFHVHTKRKENYSISQEKKFKPFSRVFSVVTPHHLSTSKSVLAIRADVKGQKH